ncbi:MAG: threonine--tRNA ligase, partial [Nitrospirales bacterium]
KVEIIKQIEDDRVSLYQQGDFVDLCRGPHVGSTGQVKALKLLTSAGAYWRGDERNPMLQRIYGTSFPTQSELDDHLANLEEIKRRDHRKLGKELDLFSVQDETGPGLILWHPKGAMIRLLIENFWRDQHVKNGYELVYSPHVARLDLWKTSGHVDYYRDNMFAPMTVEGSEYQLKPMNCPFHIMVYKTHLRSYRDLPIRYGELGTVYRYERSGVLHGLMRVRGFTQDDAHIFCRPDQIESEVRKVLDFTLFILRRFGFTEFELYLSTRPEKAVGTLDKWEQATDALESALKSGGFSYKIDPGEGVFYGPKIDLKIRDALGRAWQCSTVQIDFNNPERFGLTYVGEDGKTHQPIMIHRALLGSIERFFGILIEHYAGAFPTWLAPVQAKILPITDKQAEYADQVRDQLRDAGFRVEVDDRNEKIGLKVRDAEKGKVPYMLVLGKRESEAKQVSVRKRSEGDLGAMKVQEVIDLIGNDMPLEKLTTSSNHE